MPSCSSRMKIICYCFFFKHLTHMSTVLIGIITIVTRIIEVDMGSIFEFFESEIIVSLLCSSNKNFLTYQKRKRNNVSILMWRMNYVSFNSFRMCINFSLMVFGWNLFTSLSNPIWRVYLYLSDHCARIWRSSVKKLPRLQAVASRVCQEGLSRPTHFHCF